MLHDELHIYGSWWVPDHADRKAAGTLDFTVDDFGLTVNDALAANPRTPTGRVDFLHQVVPVVHGTSLDGKQTFTLINCSGTSFSAPLPVTKQTWTPEAVLIGGHVAADDVPLFESAWISFDHLAEWVGAPSLGRNFHNNAETGLLERMTLEASRSTLLEASVDGAVLRVVTWPKGRAGERSAEIELMVQVEVKLDAPLPWQSLLNDWATPIRDLIVLGTGHRTRIVEVDVELHRDDAEARRKSALELRFRPIATRAPDRSHSFEMPLRAAEIPGGFAIGVQRWWDLRVRHIESIQQVNGLVHSPFEYLENRFLTVLRAADAYHAVEFGSVPSAGSDHEDRLQRVRDATTSLDADDRDWLEGLLESSDPPSARHRIESLLAELPDVGDAISGGQPERYASALSQTRNRIAHPHSRAGRHVLTDSESRHWFAEGLLWLIRAHLIVGLGVDRSNVHDHLRRSRRFQFLCETMTRLMPDEPS